MRSGTLDKLSGLPAARTALEQAQAAYDAARIAYDEAREDPLVQQLYQEAAAPGGRLGARPHRPGTGRRRRAGSPKPAGCRPAIRRAVRPSSRRKRPESGGVLCRTAFAGSAVPAAADCPGRGAEPGQSRCAGRKSPAPAGARAGAGAGRPAGTRPAAIQPALCLQLCPGAGCAGPVPHPVRQPGAHRPGAVRRPAGTGPAGLPGPLPQGHLVPHEGRHLQRTAAVPGAEPGHGAAVLRRGGLPL